MTPITIDVDDVRAVESTEVESAAKEALSLAKTTVKEQESWMAVTDDLEKEISIIRRARQVAVNLNTFSFMRLARIGDKELWKQRKDENGNQLYASFDAFLRAAEEEINISHATYYRGAAALGRAQQLGVADDTLLNHAPGTLDRVLREVTNKRIDPVTKKETYDWKSEFTKHAEAQGMSPTELMEFILTEAKPIRALNTVMERKPRVVTHTIITNRTFETENFDGWFRQEIHINGAREMSLESDGATNEGLQALISQLDAQHMIDVTVGTGDRI